MPALDTVLKISMHVVLGASKEQYTFTITAKFGDIMATTLVDSGSSATFMSPELTNKIKCLLIPHSKIKAMVANGQALYTEFHTDGCNYQIQGHDLTFDFKLLPLKGYDVILGTDWIKFHNPVTLDYKKMYMQITLVTNELLTIWDESLPTSPHIKLTDNINLLQEDNVCGVVVWV